MRKKERPKKMREMRHIVASAERISYLVFDMTDATEFHNTVHSSEIKGDKGGESELCSWWDLQQPSVPCIASSVTPSLHHMTSSVPNYCVRSLTGRRRGARLLPTPCREPCSSAMHLHERRPLKGLHDCGLASAPLIPLPDYR